MPRLESEFLYGINSFIEGQEEVEDMPRSGRPLTSMTDDNIEKSKNMARQDCQLSMK